MISSGLAKKSPASVAATMQLVLLALVPGSLVFIFQNGWGSVINLSLAMVSALLFESAAMLLRKRPATDAVTDYTAVVTAVLIALCLPPLLPWWIPVLATGFAILLAKHAFGGIGYNLFNPAMAGYAIILISFPLDLSLWLQQPDMFTTTFTDSFRAVFNGGIAAMQNWDGITGATALDQHRTQRLEGTDLESITLQTHGWFGALHSEWVNLAFLVGGLWMILKRVISWHIPVGFLATLLLATLLHNLIHTSPLSVPVNMFGGATMLCAFFISTDPVSAAASKRGRLIYASLTGILVYLIRTWGAYPDGVAFAVLLANCAVPSIDRLDIWLSSNTDD